jgi:hypothetical protein
MADRAPHALTDPHQPKLWPDWRYFAFLTDLGGDAASVDAFHRQHATVELAIRDLKEGAGLEHVPSGKFTANSAWLQCAVLAYNLTRWTATIADPSPSRAQRRPYRAPELINIPSTPGPGFGCDAVPRFAAISGASSGARCRVSQWQKRWASRGGDTTYGLRQGGADGRRDQVRAVTDGLTAVGVGSPTATGQITARFTHHGTALIGRCIRYAPQ